MNQRLGSAVYQALVSPGAIASSASEAEPRWMNVLEAVRGNVAAVVETFITLAAVELAK